MVALPPSGGNGGPPCVPSLCWNVSEPASSPSLPAALEHFGIVLPPPQVDALARYCRLLWEWNTRLNLTRHTDYDRFVARDLVDSLAFAELLEEGERVLDVGTGGGVPGVVLAIVRPDLRVTLSESVGKKARAVEAIVRDLALSAAVYHGRAEALLDDRLAAPPSPAGRAVPPAESGRSAGKPEAAPGDGFDTLLVRAVAPLPKLLTWFRPRCDAFDRLLVLKGPGWVEERGEARHRGLMHGLALRRRKVYATPGTGAQSVLLEIRRR